MDCSRGGWGMVAVTEDSLCRVHKNHQPCLGGITVVNGQTTDGSVRGGIYLVFH